MARARDLGWIGGSSALQQLEAGIVHGVTEKEAAACGLTRELAQREHAQVPAHVLYQHLERVAARGNLERFVMDLSQRHTAATLGLVGLVARTRDSARSALASLLEFQALFNTMVTMHTAVSHGALSITEHRHASERAGALVASEVWALASVCVTRSLLGQGATPAKVLVRRRHPATAVYQALTGCPVEGGARHAEVVWEERLLDVPWFAPDADVAAYLEAQARKALAAIRPEARRVDEVRGAIGEDLASGPPPLAQVARHLGTSPRSLQRELQALGTRYEAVLDAYRADQARVHLSSNVESMLQVALALGFADASAFHRACHRWFGATPAEIHRQWTATAPPSAPRTPPPRRRRASR
jgi:AraC-like DNA-binding protein